MLEQKPLPWLPVSEAAFLLWVLVALIVGWLVVGLILSIAGMLLWNRRTRRPGPE